MQCSNKFCIYWCKDKCMLGDAISLDIQGSCEACIYVDFDSDELEERRKSMLEYLDEK